METIFRIVLFIVGAINLLPSLLAFQPGKFHESYGIDLPSESYELLLRHRAVLLGIIGGIMLYSSLTKKYYPVVFSVGIISMGSYILLYLLIGKGLSPELKKVLIVDIIGLCLLFLGLLLYKLKH